MQITLDVSEKVAAKAEADGVSVEAFVRKILDRAAEPERAAKPVFEWDSFGPGPYSPQEAVRRMRELSERLTLGGDVTLKDLIHEGHQR